MNELLFLTEKLAYGHSLSIPEYETLISGQNDQLMAYAAELARKLREKYYGTDVYIRGLIEVGNVCRNDCLYCGIRKSNSACVRYVLTKKQILQCCAEGYKIGFRTFVLQGGENVIPVKRICDMVSSIRSEYSDCAITLSFGEYSHDDYVDMYRSGANRYLLRHETADKTHYQKLHPSHMSFENHMRCLYDLKDIGFQVGCGFMVGSPYQSDHTLAQDLKFIEQFQPDMCGVGPFIPHKDTPFADFPAGTAEQTIFLLSLIRLIKPNILLPATTALGSVVKNGRELGIMAGANVIMPNLSPIEHREKYTLYNNKLVTGAESAQNLNLLKESMKKIGYRIVTARGDAKKEIII